jgi:hypothetical protein
VGNPRAVVLTTQDAVAPAATVTDPDNIVYAVSASAVQNAVTGKLLGKEVGAVGQVGAGVGGAQTGQQAATSTTTLVGAAAVARANVDEQPPILISFPNGATNPEVVVYEWAAP